MAFQPLFAAQTTKFVVVCLVPQSAPPHWIQASTPGMSERQMNKLKESGLQFLVHAHTPPHLVPLLITIIMQILDQAISDLSNQTQLTALCCSALGRLSTMAPTAFNTSPKVPALLISLLSSSVDSVRAAATESMSVLCSAYQGLRDTPKELLQLLLESLANVCQNLKIDYSHLKLTTNK